MNDGAATRSRWIDLVERLALPVLVPLAEGRLRASLLPERHPQCDEGRLRSSHLEAASRLLLGIAPWLACTGADAGEARRRDRIAQIARAGIQRGCDPGDADWFGFDRDHQPIVDAAFLACALLRAPAALHDPLSPAERGRIARAFAGLRDRKPYFNNWLLFAASTEAYLASAGEAWDPMRVDFALRQHEQWYLGDGHYGDGPALRCDYYNSFVIAPLLGDLHRALAGRDGHWDQLAERLAPRLRRQAEIQERMIAPDGSWPPIGRSIAYRCGAFHTLAWAAWRGLLPEGVHPAQARCALDATVRRSLERGSNWRGDGFLAIGLNGHQPGLGETYITTGSLYLAAAVLLPLGLPPSDPFWSAPDRPWTSVALFERGDDRPADHALHDRH